MSIAALHARLEQIASAIETQEEILKNLRLTRCGVLRQLNDLRDPVSRLPLEIASEIFKQYLPNSPSPPSIPLLLSSVCNSWTDIALETPCLWADLRVDAPPRLFKARPELAAQYKEHLSVWLGRTRARPLSLSLTGYSDTSVATIITRHAPQFRTLNLGLPSADIYLEIFRSEASFTNLKYLSIRSPTHDGGPYDGEEFIKVFQSAPNLIKCTFENRYYWKVDGDRDGVQVIHRRLQSLTIHSDSDSALMLEYLTAPALKILDISAIDMSEHFTPFLARSSPPLKKLTLGLGADPPFDVAWEITTIEAGFALIPNLTHLRFKRFKETSEELDKFLIVLARPPPHNLLPNLIDFAITLSDSDDWIPPVFEVASMRRCGDAKLQSFHLEWVRESRPSVRDFFIENVLPDADKTILHALAAGGLQIHLTSNWRGNVQVYSLGPDRIPPSLNETPRDQLICSGLQVGDAMIQN
ncbi:hypothetical protein B0H17DRAFT_1301848 [Mycena rosella]|uniref:F-box domain-containing protein n=1 Tax=Mycena rosella TaxID=1033263 RepID=A0AAD7M7S6_MYCRO|nr:hypothetical protein B0H17DRAFT_1301848 [Mycena rosella]